MEFTKTFWKNVDAKKRLVFNQGGTGSGKTYGEIQKEIIIARKRKVLTGIFSESIPHLKMTGLRDFKNIMHSNNWWGIGNWHDTDKIYTFPNGSEIEFFSADNPGKMHGGRRTRMLGIEIQNIPYEIYNQAEIRTSEQITGDYNPTSIFWANTQYIDNPAYDGMIDFIHSTYLDNKYLQPEIIQSILARAENDPNFDRVYIKGLPGSLEGLIFSNYEIVDEMPEEFKWVRYGLDFGFTNDPSAFIKVGFVNGSIYVDELFYETGLLNIPNPLNSPNIVQRFKENVITHRDTIIADSAEVKSIMEIRTHGFNIIPAKKGKDSIKETIDILKRYKIYITKRSVNAIKEIRNYSWKVNKIGEKQNEPIDNYNHCLDPLRYIAQYMLTNNQTGWR